MKNEIQVKLGITHTSYGSFEEAVVASKNRRSLLKEKLALIDGNVMTGYEFNGFDLCIKFGNGKYLTISPSGNSIAMDVVVNSTNIDMLLMDKNVSFVHTSGKVIDWEIEEILTQLLNKKIVISPSDQCIFIFEPNGIEYMFSYLVNVNDLDQKYLTLCEA